MVNSNMSPFGGTVIEDQTLQYMLPTGETVSLFAETEIFPPQFAVQTAVALFGITP